VQPGRAEHLTEQLAGPVEDLRLAGERRVAGHEADHLDHPRHPVQASGLLGHRRERVEHGHPGLLRRDSGRHQAVTLTDLAGDRQLPVHEG
jgi:hypothetical protein